MNKALSIIQTLIIIVLLIIIGTMAYQLREYQNAYGILANRPMFDLRNASDSAQLGKVTPTPADQIPDFSKVTNSATNSPEIEAAIGIAAQDGTTGYRLSKDGKKLVYLNPEHMVMVDVASKEPKELISFKKWDRKLPSETKECVAGSRFVKPTFNDAENLIFFGAPSQGQDALYQFELGKTDAKLVTLTNDCITDIAVSPKGQMVAYQTSTTLSTLSEGYMTNIGIVKADGNGNQVIAKYGLMPHESIAEGDRLDFAPAEILWTSEDAFYVKGFFQGRPTGVWKYETSKNAFKFATNLNGGP